MLKFEAIQNIRRVILKTESKLPSFVRVALIANTIQLSDYNRDQLMSGKDSKGNSLPNYSPASVNSFGKPPGPIKLYDTGDFQKSIKPNFGNEAFEMTATDEKTAMLQYDYGEEILGVDQNNLDELADDVSGQVVFELKKHFGAL